jgi:Cu(I)/Ag(I) efflux system membrane fusion protein
VFRRWPLPGLLALGAAVGVLAAVFLPESALFVDSDVAGGSLREEGVRWACPMLCIVLDEPGVCPVCGMDLEAIRLNESGVLVTESGAELSGLTVAVADFRNISAKTTLPATVLEAEPGTSVITAWTSGRIDDLLVSETGERVVRGQHVARLYSPELIEAQQEFLITLQNDSSGPMLENARRRLEQLGAPPSVWRTLESGGEASASVPVASAYSGVVVERYVDSGDWVSRGQALLRLSDLSTVWISADLFENQLHLVSVGDSVAVYRLGSSDPEATGVVDHIDPFLDPMTRTAAARITASNANGSWVPGQLVSIGITVKPDTTEFVSNGSYGVLSVPDASVLMLGRRSIVYLLSPDEDHVSGSDALFFEPRLLEVGDVGVAEDGQLYRPVRMGLLPGDLVAAGGTFLLDSQAELTGLTSLLNAGGEAGSDM